MNDFEATVQGRSFADPVVGYPAHIDVASFVDHFIVNELFRNIDAYRLSAFLFKDRDSAGGKLQAGSIWDFNLSAGLAFFYQDIGETKGWVVDYNLTHPSDFYRLPFWWEKSAHEANFQTRVSERWTELREGILDSDELMVRIDSLFLHLHEARDRNWLRWGNQISGFARGFGSSNFWEDSTLLIKWFPERIQWIDDHVVESVAIRSEDSVPKEVALEQNYPNPFNPATRIEFSIQNSSHVNLTIYNMSGQRIQTLLTRGYGPGSHSITWNGCDDSGISVGSGIYIYQLRATSISEDFLTSRKMLLVR